MAEHAGAFVKYGAAVELGRFEAEAEGLAALAEAGEIRVPAVLDCGIEGDRAFLVLERLAFERPTRDVEWRFGEQLARLHAHTAERYGWHRDNTIGLTPQNNRWCEDWTEFLREQRLGFQLELAAKNGYRGELGTLGERVLGRLDRYFEDYAPEASLLHGDLWSGNWGVAAGEPVIFDPAVHYGDSESDIAMTELFGGFGQAFYEAYAKHRPFADGHRERIELYKLYHVLNHLNLFGGGYLGQAVAIMNRLA